MESICIEDRRKLTLIGATRVVSSTNNQAVVEIGEITVVITGNNLEVVKLDLENKQVNFSGNISAVKYLQKAEKKSLLKRLFK